jgi:hypothetical protein
MPRWLQKVLYRGPVHHGVSGFGFEELYIHEANPLMQGGRVMAGINPIHQTSAYIAYPQPVQTARRGMRHFQVAWSENHPLDQYVMDRVDPIWDPGVLRQYPPSAMPQYNPTLTGSSV